jgi:hypothetical protein
MAEPLGKATGIYGAKGVRLAEYGFRLPNLAQAWN